MRNGHNKRNLKISAIIIGIILAVIIIVLFILLLNGKTTTTGNYPDNVSDESLTCTANNIKYPFFTYDNATKKEAEINILFSRDKLKSIALTYSLYYDNQQSITGSEAHNHAAMNISFGKNGMGADALNANYAKLENRMRMSLYANGNEISNISLQYFFITTNSIPENVAAFKNIYQGIGFKCESNK